MKAERRHELQTNSLARFLENLPLYFRFHLTKIIVGVLVVLLLVVLIRHRVTTGAVARQQAAVALGDVRRLLNELQVVDLTRPTLEQRAADRRRYASQIDGSIDEILAQTGTGPEDAGMRAEAIVARGDLNWIMGNLPPLPGAATQPALQMPRSQEQYLAEAQAAYEQVLKEYPNRQMSALTAAFGLANIAENRGEWETARVHYESIVNRDDAPQSFKDWASLRMQWLPILQEPLFTGTIAAPQAALPEPIAAPEQAQQAQQVEPGEPVEQVEQADPAEAPATQPGVP